jgi:hypothetical protein
MALDTRAGLARFQQVGKKSFWLVLKPAVGWPGIKRIATPNRSPP